MGRIRKTTQEEGPQPSQHTGRTNVKVREETASLLIQVARFRGEKMIDCVHNLLVEEVRRRRSDLTKWITEVSEQPPMKSGNKS